MEVVIIMKKGYSLVEILVSLVLLASLLVCVGSIFISGLKYKTRASDYYDVFNNVDQSLESFQRLQQEYQHRTLSKSGAYLKADDLVILHYENKVLTFYFLNQITTTISDVDLLEKIMCADDHDDEPKCEIIGDYDKNTDRFQGRGTYRGKYLRTYCC